MIFKIIFKSLRNFFIVYNTHPLATAALYRGAFRMYPLKVVLIIPIFVKFLFVTFIAFAHEATILFIDD